MGAALAVSGLTSCQTTSPQQLAAPTGVWQTRTGQLAYTGPRMSLIGEVIVRSTKAGDFELTFTKGPGVTLLTVRSDTTTALFEGPLARGRWSGPLTGAPERLRGWLALREKILAGGGKSEITHLAGGETFNLRF